MTQPEREQDSFEDPLQLSSGLEDLEPTRTRGYSCPYCDRNDLKGQRGMTQHCQSQHPKKAVPDVGRQNFSLEDLSKEEQIAFLGTISGLVILYVLYRGAQSYLTWLGENPVMGGLSLVTGVGVISGGAYYVWRYRKRKQKERKQREEELHTRVISTIRNFEPSQNWNNEEGYQGELQGRLKSEFGSEVEVTKGASRTDLQIEDIAIEIKGPTSHQDLDSVASKAMKYSQHWSNVVIVMFNVQVSDEYYQEWRQGMEEQHPDVELIRIETEA